METVAAAESRFGTPVWLARDLVQADAVIVVNRIKPHTDFYGPIESGLVKMLVIGAGKQRGAARPTGSPSVTGSRPCCGSMPAPPLQRLPVLYGVALLEDQHELTAELHLLPASEIIEREPSLLERAKALMPSVPFDVFDCLIIDEIGKEISGAGIDSKIVGRIDLRFAAQPDRPHITRIVVRDLTAASHGNAIGIGSADFTTTRLLAAVDRDATAVNCITSISPEAGRLPIAFDRDVDAVQAAYETSGAASPEEFSVVWIRNTLCLEEILVSTALLPQARSCPDLEIDGDPFPFPAAADGALGPTWSDD